MSVPSPRALANFPWLHRLKRLWRAFALKLGHAPPFLVFDPAYREQLRGVPVDPLRGEKLLAFLSMERLIRREQVTRPLPAAMKNLLLAHDPAYLESLQQPETLTRILGLPVLPGQEEHILQLQRLMVGGTIQATRLVLAGAPLAVHLGGGFHHAFRDRGSGFCVFNDIAVAILRLRQKGFSGNVLVVDLDLHDGNGTRQIFAHDPTVFTLSVHNRHWGETKAQASLSIALGDEVEDLAYLQAVEEALEQVLQAFSPNLAIYVAGVDVAAGDPLGNWRITPEGVLRRDQLVLGRLRQDKVPVVMLLAGGYGDHAWRHTARTLAWYLTGDPMEPPSDELVALARLRQLPDLLGEEPEDDADWGLSEEDLFGVLPALPVERRFLGAFSPVRVELVLERMGLLQQIRAKGFACPTVSLELDHPLGHTLRIFGDPQRSELLLELRVARTSRAIPGFEVLAVEWLLLQNPRAAFTPDRPPLPGQQHPGLGLLAEVFALLVRLCEELALDGLYFRPSHYHLAALARRHATFLQPEHAALFSALAHLLAQVPLPEASRLVHEGKIINRATGERIQWEAFPMVLPVSQHLRQLVEGAHFQEKVATTLPTLQLAMAEGQP
ncbi:MAG: histone deacetylase [Thermoanaerobaculum sp.]|nr:histone deacetylase [Thermoanaerobaculum sp.]MDW7967692.1 histone deacetylase [Thermoanaerobaculum sp.]